MSQLATLISFCLLCVTLPGRAIFQTRFIGNTPIDRSIIDEWKESIYIINYNKPHPGGVITSWSVYVRNEGQFALLVLRRDQSDFQKYVIKYVDEYFSHTSQRHRYEKECHSSGCFTMKQNDLIGFYFRGDGDGLVPFDKVACSTLQNAIYYVKSGDKPVSYEVGNSYRFIIKNEDWGRCRLYSLKVTYNVSGPRENPGIGGAVDTTTIIIEKPESGHWYVYVGIAAAVIVLVVICSVVIFWMNRKNSLTTRRQRQTLAYPTAAGPTPNSAFFSAQNPAFIPAPNPAFNSAPTPVFISASAPTYPPPVLAAPQGKLDVLPPSYDQLYQTPQPDATQSPSVQQSQYNNSGFPQGYNQPPTSTYDNPTYR